MKEKIKMSANEKFIDTSSTETCSDIDLLKESDEATESSSETEVRKESDEATETCSDNDFLKESDEEPSDNEEEKEHYIVQYPTESIVKKGKNDAFSDPLSSIDPLGEVNKEIIIRNIVCCYCSFACDSDFILLTHISQNHKIQPSTYTCNFPLCDFKSSNLIQWITHKNKCPNNPDAPNKKSNVNLKDESKQLCKNQENTKNVGDVINQKEKLPIIKVKPDYKLKSPVAQEPMLDEPKESQNLVLKLKPPGVNLFKGGNQAVLKKLKKSSNSKTLKKNLEGYDKPVQQNFEGYDPFCHKFEFYTTHSGNRKFPLKPYIDPFGDDLLHRIRIEIENQAVEDHSYSKINFFHKMGLSRLKNGANKLALIYTIEHLKSKLDFALLPNLRCHPEQMVLLNLIRQLEQLTSSYTSDTIKSDKHINLNFNPLSRKNKPLKFSPEEKIKLLVQKKNVDKILVSSDAKILKGGNFSSIKSVRTILPKKLEEKKINFNRSSMETPVRAGQSSKLNTLSSMLKREKMDVTVQKVTAERNYSDKISLNKAVKTKINSEEQPTSPLKRLISTSTDAQNKQKTITCDLKVSNETVTNKRTSSKVQIKENVSSNKNKRSNMAKDEKLKVKRQKIDESPFEVSMKDQSSISSCTLKENVVTLAHTCKRSTRRRITRGWTRRKKYKATCQACVEEKKKAVLIEPKGKTKAKALDSEVNKATKVRHVRVKASK